MNEKALETLYSLAKKDGYNKSLEEFKTLMRTNGDAVNKMYSLAQSDGYSKKKEDFNTLVGFESTQKKNSNSPLSSGLDSENSQGSPSDGGQDGSPTESGLDATSAEESRVLSINSTRELAGSLQGWDEEISRYQDFYNEEKRVEDPFSADNTFEIEYTPAGQEGVVSFSQAGGVGEESQAEVEKEVDIRKRERELFQSGANTLEVIEFGNKERGHYESMNDLYSKALPEEQDNLFIQDEETGLTKLNPAAYAKYSVKLEEVLEEDERRLAQEMDKLSEKNELQEIGYDLWTGTRSIGYGFMGLWNPEQAQYNLYQDQARTQASYKIEGLTDEEIEKGLFKNLSEGNWNAFTTMFGTQLAQTAPQLAMQAAIAAGTGGLGLSASSAMWASSAVMGLQTFGSTSAQYYGLVDDNKRYMMAFGDALVETLSERAFPDDMMALTKKQYKGVSLDNIRRDFFKKGLMTKEFRKMAAQHAQRTGVQVLESGLEEGMEEALAGIGSQFIHSMVNDEEMNMFEVIDGMIVGFGAGAKSRGFRALNETITATASSLGFGGIRNNLIKVKGQKQKLAKELQITTDEVRRAQIESKLKSLTKIELNMKRDMNDVYSEYSDEDAENTIKQNQKFQNAMLKYKKAEGREAKDAARAEAKAALKAIQSIEAKYEGQVKSVQEQREAAKNYDFGESGTVDINEDTDTKGIKILEGLKNIKKALGKDAKVQVHDSYESMAKALKVDKSKVEDSAGIYNGKDGSIHVFLPAAMENTSYHEAFHKIAETVDSKYRKKFVDAAIAGMSDELAQKYKDFGQQYKGDNKLMYEEMFVEMLADVSTGAISIDNVGASVASMAMGEVFKLIQKAGFLKKRTLPTFKDFVSFLETEADNLRNGTELKRDKTWSPKNPRKAVSFFKQLKQDSENNKRPIQQSMSEHEILGDNWSMENSTITDKMQMNKNGNFVFSHVSNKKLDNVDPQYFGKNHLTSSEERREVGLAGVSLSMYGVNPNDIDVAGEYTYMVEINPNEVYNAVDDPKGLVAKAKAQLKEEGKAASDNTVFALASKMAAKEGYKMVVTPWTKTKVRAQTVSKLDVVPYVEFDPVKLYDIETEVVPPIDTRKAVNTQAKSILNAVKGVIPSSLYMRLDKMSYSALDGRFGAVNNLDEYVELLETALDEVDLSNPDSDIASGILTNAISEAFRFADSKGYTRRVQSEEARKKTIEKVQNEIANNSEGFTIDPITGEFMTEGVAVGDAKGEVAVDLKGDRGAGINQETIRKTIERALSNPIAAIGGWFNSENGQFYLDVSEVYDNRETAVRLGKKRKEFGVFDMSTGDYIPTATEEDHDNRDSNDLKKQKILDDRSEVEKLTEMMNSMPDAHVQWVEPVGTASVIVDPIKSNPNKVTKAILKALGYKSVSDLTKPTSAFNGIPSIPAMSDILGSGEMKDANGNPMTVNGGITTGLFGSSFKDGVAWCGVTRHDAEVQLNDALNVYNANKPYFEKIWADETNPIPYGHVPMVIMRMSDTAVNSNEAVFRYISPYIKNFPKQNRANAFNAFKARVEADKAWLDEKLERHEQGLPMMDKRTRTVKDPSKKQSGLTNLEMNQIKSQERLLKFFEEHNITTLDQLMDLIAGDSHKRARAAVDKKSSEGFIQLTDKEYITSILFRVHADTKSGYKTRSKPNEIVKELFGEQEGDAEKFTFHNVVEAIAEPSMRDIKSNHAVAVMGVDVLNPAVIETTHENYGFGPKGRFIAVLSDPRHGADIFPEWEVKLSRMATSGTKTKDSIILSSVGSTFFGDKVFRGSAIQTESSKEVNTIIAKMRHAFPFVHLAKSQESFEETANQEGTETVTSPDGVVLYALTKDGVIVLNPSIDTVNAAVGQFGHVWLKFLSEGASKFGKDLLAKGMKLAEETDLYEQNLEKRNGDKKAAAMDTLAQLIGNKGSNIQEAAKQSKFKSWMKGLYELIRTNFKVIFSRDSDDKMRMNRNEKKEFFERMTLDNFLDLSVAELFQGKQVKSEYRPSPVEQTSSQLKKQKIGLVEGVRSSLDSKDFANAKMSKKEIKDYKEGKHLADKNPDEFGSTVAMDRELFNNYVETDGYNGRKLAERLVEALESQEAQSELAYRLPILKEMISKGFFENTTVILDRGSMMSTEMDMQYAGGFFTSNRDDSIVINMASKLSAEWMAYMLIHEQMHRLTSLELDNTNSVTFKALSLIMDEVSYEGFQNYKATDETRKYNQEDNNRYREARIKREEKGDVKLTSQESAVLASREYGFENVHELVAEAFSNAEFQTLLSKIKLSDDLKNQLEGLGIEMKQNLFEQFKEIVKSFLGKIGVPIQNQSILDAVMAVADNLVSQQKAEGSNGVFFKQKTQAYIEVAQQIRNNVSKKDIIAELVERGYSKKDANSLYQKAAGYKIGNNAGYRQGVKERNEAYREARKKQLAEERLEAKFLRQRAKEIFKKEKRVTDAMIKEISDYLKDKKINIKASQLKTILRLMNAAHRSIGKKTDPNHQYAVFTSFVDAVARIIDKQMDAKQIEEHANLLRKVNKQQSNLKNRIKSMSKASKSPLTSYIKQVDNLISLDGGVLTYESLERLSNALSSLEVTVKSVSVRKNKDGEKVLGNPYFEVEGEMVNGRRAKMYFDEVFNELKNEEIQRTEERMIELAMDKAYEEGTDWYTAYQELLRKKMEKELKPMEKKLKAIADDLGLDLDNVDDMETAFEIYEEEKREDEEQTKSIIINDAILPVVQTHLSLLLSNSDFQDILGWNPELPYETNMDNVKARLNELRLSELKRLEFFTYDHLANGKTYGLKALSAVVRAKNDGNAKLNKLNMKASAAKGLRGGYFSLMENTPTFFRRIFKQYSQGKVAEYMNAIGFGNIRKNVAQAEARHEAFVGRVRTKLGELNMLSSSAQMQMQLYSLFRQKPEGVTDAAWVVYVKNSIELALAEDTRISDKQRSEIEVALAVLKDGRRSRSLSQIVEQLEQVEGLVEAVEYLEMEFAAQEPKVREYAENFLGMHFKEESNYLPMMFRAVGSKASEVDELIQKVENVGKAMASHNLTRANSQASSTYERDVNAIKTQKRYIDLNFLSAIEKTYKENEIKTATAEDVAYISVMTSEKNDSFVDSVDDKDIRAAIRKKVYNYLVNASDYQQADEILGKHGAKAAKYAMNITVVAYFGATIEQLLKQGSAMANALFETRSMAARMIYFNALGDLRGAVIGKGIDSSLPYAELINKFPIGNRNITTEVLMVGAEAKIGEKGRIEKGVEKSTTFLRGTDEMVATATWLAYYADYLISEQGVDPKDIDWAKESENPNDNAAMFAEQMTVKDQNISSRRDKSRINEIMRGQLMQVVKMVAMPFANFLFNKKLNLALDMQKAFVGDKKAKGEAIRSLAGTVAEVYAFQAAAWAILSPMYAAIGSALFGADDEEEESWWDKKFGNQMIKRGMYLDLNPLVVPVAAMEHWFLHLSNMAQYGLTQDQDDWRYADEDWSKGFERWERMNGMPIFKGAGRDDFGSKDFFSMLGVTGNVAYDITNTMSNIKTLSDKTPSYTTSTGQRKYISTKDADKMLLIETGRLTLLGIMAGTGLHSKELSKILKEGKKPMERRAEADIERWIGNEIMAGNEVGLDEMIDYLNTEIEGDPTNAMSKIDSIIKKAKGSTEVMESLVSKENINTMRVIDKSETSNRGRAIMIHHIAKDMSPEEAKQFVLDSYLYFGIKYGVETVKSQAIADILKFGNNE